MWWGSLHWNSGGESRNEGFPSLKKLSLTAVPFFEWEKVLLFEHPLSMNIVQIIVRDFDFWSLCRVNSLARRGTQPSCSEFWPTTARLPHLKEIPFKLLSPTWDGLLRDKDPSLFIIINIGPNHLAITYQYLHFHFSSCQYSIAIFKYVKRYVSKYVCT